MNRDTVDVRLVSATRVVGVSLGRQVAVGAGVLAMLAGAGVVAGAPEGAKVSHGSATIKQVGDLTKITAANNTIIDYSRFNVGSHESVRFIQPSAQSRVLNRIHSADPSRIDGSITANGQVYFANPAGVIFGAGSMINVGSIYAAAGNISSADFLKGVDRFTDLSGSVINNGDITAAAGGAVALIGKHVENAGSINAVRGMVAMVSGDDVLVGAQGDHLFIRFEGAAKEAQAAEGGSAGVTNTGDINARGGRVTMAGGDTLGLTLFSGGSVKAKKIELNNPGGDTVVTGTLDASNLPDVHGGGGGGGNVDIVGNRVGLAGATVDVSGSTGGGSVRVGGDFQGKGDLPRAQQTVIDKNSTIRADATGAGDGGRVIVWSDEATRFRGEISAKGKTGGDGGFVEVSSKGQLGFSGGVNVGAGAGGEDGLLLLDPTDVRIVGAPTNPDIDDQTEFPTPNSASVVFGDADSAEDGAAGDLSILNTAIENATGDVLIQATDDIAVEADVTLGANRNITLQAQDDIFVGADLTGTPTGGGTITTAGTGAITVTAGDDIEVHRGLVTGGGAVNLRADGAVNGVGADGGNGAILITSAGGIATSGGNIDLNAGDTVTSDFTLEAGGSVDAGAGTLMVRANAIDVQDAMTGDGGITLLPGDDATSIGLGTGAGTFSLTAAEMANLGSTGTVTVGRSDSTATVNIQDLDLSATTTYDLTVIGNNINVNEGATPDPDTAFRIADGHTLRLEAIGPPAGSTIDIQESIFVDGGTIVLLADDIDSTLGLEPDGVTSETISAGATGTVWLAATTGTAVQVGLGTGGGNTINDGTINGVRALTLIIGAADSGAMAIDDSIAPTVTNLTLLSGSTIVEDATDTAVELTVPGTLRIEAVGQVGDSGVDEALDFDAAVLDLAASGGAYLRHFDTDTLGLTVSQLNATTGNVVLNSSHAVTLAAGTVTAGNATVTADTGNLLVDSLTASGAVSLTATTGGVRESGTDAGAEVTAASLSVTSLTGLVGTGGVGAIETAVSSLSVNATGTSEVNVDNTSTTLALGSVTTNDGPITIGQSGSITDDANDATADVTVGGSNALTLTAGTNIGTAGNSVDISAPTVNATATSGLVNLNSLLAAPVSFGTLSAGAAVTVVAAQDLAVGTVTAGGLSPVSLTATTGDLTFDQIGSSGTPVAAIVLVATTGSINEAGAGDVGTDLFGATLTATSATGFGNDATAGAIETALTTAGVSVTGAGDIGIAEADDLLVSQIIAANGDIDMTLPGTLNDDADDNTVDLMGTTIGIQANAGFGTANGSLDVDGESVGFLFLTGGANFNLLDSADNGIAFINIGGSSSGGITVESTTASAGTFSFASLIAPSGNISITTTDAGLTFNNATAATGSFSASSGGGQTIVNGTINTSGGNGNIALTGTDIDIPGALNAGVGDVTLTQTDPTADIQLRDDGTEVGFTLSPADLTNIASTGAVTIGAGSASTNGDITFNTSVGGFDLSAKAYDLVLRGDQLAFTNAVGGGAAALEAPMGGVAFQVDGPVSRSGAGATDIRAASVSFANVNGAIGATGAGRIRTETSALDFSTTAGGAFFSNTGNLDVADSSAGGGGAVEVVTTGTLAVNDITTTGNVTLSGTDISQAASNTVSGSLLTATASTGAIDLVTAVSSLSATAATTIDIANTGALVVTSALTTSGDINLSASDFSVTSINAGSGANDVTLSRTGGGTIGVGSGAGATGSMTLTGADLSGITARDLILGDSSTTAINVGTVSQAQTTNIGRTVRLTAGGASGDVNFNDDSAFPGLIVSAADNVQLNGDVTVFGTPAAVPGPGFLSISAGSIGVDTTDGDSERVLSSSGAIALGGSLDQQIPLRLDAMGDFMIVGGSTITTNNNDLTIIADDVVFEDGMLTGSIDAGTGGVTISRPFGGIIRVGDYLDASFPSDMVVSRSDLQHITAGDLTIGASSGLGAEQVRVNGVTASDLANISGVQTFQALAAGGTVTFETAASVFKTLVVNARDGITASVALTANGDGSGDGSMSFNANTDSGPGTLTLSATPTIAGDLDITASDVVLADGVDLAADTITLNTAMVQGVASTFTADTVTATGSALTLDFTTLTLDTALDVDGVDLVVNAVLRTARDLMISADSLVIDGGVASVGTPRDLVLDVDGDTTLIGEFGTAAAGGMPLGRMATNGTGRTILSGNFETTEGYLFNEQLLLAGDTVLADSGTGSAIFNTTIDSQTADMAGLSVFLNTGINDSDVPVEMPLISFSEDVGSGSGGGGRLKHLRLNSGRGSVPVAATILVAERDASGNLVDFDAGGGFGATAGEGDVFTFRTLNDFSMGRREKMTVVGDIVIEAGSAALSDITSIGKVTVDSPTITLLAREGGQVLNFQGIFDVDGGLDFAAADGFDFSSVPTRDGGGLVSFGAESFADISTTIISAGVATQQFRNALSTQSLYFQGSFLDLTASGPTQTNIAQVIAGAVPRESRQNDVGGEETIGAALQNQLKQLGIYARDITGGELVDYLEGRAVYDDYPEVPDPSDRDYTVAVTRLPRESVEKLVADYNEIFRKPDLDPSGNIKLDENGEPIYIVNDRIPEMLRDSLAGYREARGKDAPLEPAAFREYLESTPKEAEALAFIESVRGFLKRMELLGLSAEEFRRARNYIVFRTIRRPSNFPARLLEGLIVGPEQPMDAPTNGEASPAAQ